MTYYDSKECCSPLPCTAGLGVAHNVHRRSEKDAVGRGERRSEKREQRSTSVVSQSVGPRAENDTDLTPLALNSSARATPLARMRRRLKVAAALIPAGNPVEFFVSLSLFSSHEYRCPVYWSHCHCKDRRTLQGHPAYKERVFQDGRLGAYHRRILRRTVPCQRRYQSSRRW